MQWLRIGSTRKQRLCAATVVLLVGSLVATAALAAAVPYLQTFDGTPAAPQPLRPFSDWDVAVHSGNLSPATWNTLLTMSADHGSDCSAPPATHTVSSYDEAVFLCNNHAMTALFADGGYGAIYLTPPALVDFSAGEAVIRFDVSTARTSPRDWIDLWVSPYDEHIQLPLEDWLPDLQGPPRHAVHLRMDNTTGGSMFRTLVVRDFATQEVSTNIWPAYESVLTPSATTRTTFELRLSRTHLKFGLPAYNVWWMDGAIADLGWSSGVVQFGHHSYNPLKDCPAGQTCRPNTWHWDNVSLSAAVPFTLQRASPRAVDSTAAPPVTLAQPAPPNARLRFAGFGSNLQVSFDGGATWQAAQLQAQAKQDTGHFASYWTPIPAGVTQVQFRGQGGWWGSQWKVQDISLWAASAPTTGVLSDLNGDGIVDIRDYGQWRQNFGAASCGTIGDINGDCIVDIRDYGLWRQNFGAASGAAARPSLGSLPARGGLAATPVSSPTPVRTPTPRVVRSGVESARSHP